MTSPRHRLLRAALPSAFPSALVAAVLGSGACTTGPVTGQLGEPGTPLPFTGFTEAKAAGIAVYVMRKPELDPSANDFVKIGTGVGSSTPISINSTTPAYQWNVQGRALTQAEWPPGGLVRLKAMRGTSELATFDTYGVPCAYAKIQAGASWITAGQDCQSPYPSGNVITMVSTSTNPALKDTPQYLGVRGGSYPSGALLTPSDREGESQHYYATFSPPGTLTAFKAAYGFTTGTPIRAVYYNHGDLGIARDMNCLASTINGNAVKACYVSNYGRDTTGAFKPAGFGPDDLDAQTALGQALGPQGTKQFLPTSPNVPVATVAMVYNAGLPANARVQFIVYDDAGNLSTQAALDHAGLDAIKAQGTPTAANIAVPDNCLTCHGTSSSYTPSLAGPSVVTNAHFLPFDPAGFEFVTSSTYAAFAQGPTMAKLKSLNALVWDTEPAPATLLLLKGMYPPVPANPMAVNLGPKDPTSVFTDAYLPIGWKLDPAVDEKASRAARQVYNEVVKPYCRTCHVSHDAGTLDFSSYTAFKQISMWVGTMVCNQAGTVPMPQAEQTQTRFWNSAGRAHLMSAFALPGACAP